ncbi:MAG: type III-B CRISPR module RAMP protein Cmr6 [Peptococcaceae bacterium]|jgi:CRISPR-associated protein Cmr6|nr:type III-B CRISPR module RAMP protein Cmr6 [Peptococcaceae bacterium]
MSNGIVGKLRQNSQGKWYTFIKDEVAGSEIYYLLSAGEEKTIIEGTKVVYGVRPNQGEASKPSAIDVRLFGPAYYLPRDTADLLLSSSGAPIDNTALKTQKYVRVFRDKAKRLKILSDQTYSSAEKNLLTRLARNQLDVLAAYKYSHCVTGVLGARMTVGLRGASVFGTTITLHHTYGFPYIPGSALKGCWRSFVIRDLFGGEEKDALADDGFTAVFGARGQRGGVIFLDALPTRCANLELDIINPHYSGYYKVGSPPTDDLNPNMIRFYAVPKGARFTFRLASGALDIKRAAIKGVPLTTSFKTTLSDIGVGAKTAAGYGWFREIAENSKK